MRLSRRESLRLVAGGVATAGLLPRPALIAHAAQQGVRFKVGVTDWNLKLENKPEAVAAAKRLGFDACRSASAKGPSACPSAIPRCNVSTSPSPGGSGSHWPRYASRSCTRTD